jgi:hypothetical protein
MTHLDDGQREYRNSELGDEGTVELQPDVPERVDGRRYRTVGEEVRFREDVVAEIGD